MESIKEGQTVLLIWSGISPPQDLEQVVSGMTQQAGSTGKVNVEHVDRLKLCELPNEISGIYHVVMFMNIRKCSSSIIKPIQSTQIVQLYFE